MHTPQTLFLASHGGRIVDDLIADFGDVAAEYDAFDRGLCLADAADVGLLRVSGADAATFLHNQFSTNVSALIPGQGHYSTYNSPKGRMLASLFLWRESPPPALFSKGVSAEEPAPEVILIGGGRGFVAGERESSPLPSLSPCPSPAESGRGEAFPSSLPLAGERRREDWGGDGVSASALSPSPPTPLPQGERGEKIPAFFILLAADLTETVRKRLSMYVLRSKVTIEDVSATYAFLGLCGADVSAQAHLLTLSPRGRECPDKPPSVSDGHPLSKGGKHNVQTQNDITTVALSSTRLLLILPLETLPENWSQLTQNARPAGRHLWRRAAIRDGIPLITAATADRLIPQSANWDALGGLDFQKGCYPGQEIIARTRYLGRTKERLYLAHCDEAAVFDPATPLYSPAFGEQACGIVVNAAPDRQGQIMLASFQTSAADSPIHVARPDGSVLTLLPLPYELPVNETPNRVKL
ncbi:MAG: hypothetical protein FWC38_05210 [Proteobacteria bacterium]|nr:hypothetical protein [Pseudomonadota bacterium]MCL2307618.1 hypothetical protein [Pseudomonadota bacterium]